MQIVSIFLQSNRVSIDVHLLRIFIHAVVRRGQHRQVQTHILRVQPQLLHLETTRQILVC